MTKKTRLCNCHQDCRPYGPRQNRSSWRIAQWQNSLHHLHLMKVKLKAKKKVPGTELLKASFVKNRKVAGSFAVRFTRLSAWMRLCTRLDAPSNGDKQKRMQWDVGNNAFSKKKTTWNHNNIERALVGPLPYVYAAERQNLHLVFSRCCGTGTDWQWCWHEKKTKSHL